MCDSDLAVHEMGCCVVTFRLAEEVKVRHREEGSSMIDGSHDQEAAGEEDQDYCTWEEEEVLHTDDPVMMARIAWVNNAAAQTVDSRDHHVCFCLSNQPILDRTAFGKSRLLRAARPLTTVLMTTMMKPFW